MPTPRTPPQGKPSFPVASHFPLGAEQTTLSLLRLPSFPHLVLRRVCILLSSTICSVWRRCGIADSLPRSTYLAVLSLHDEGFGEGEKGGKYESSKGKSQQESCLTFVYLFFRDIKKRKAVVKEAKPKKTRKAKKASKAAKDPNQPKRPPTAFFIFLDEFRKSFKEDHPEAKGVAVVGKAGGEKWKDMSDNEKAPYIAKAQQKKQEYDKSMSAYKQKQDDEEDDEGTPEESDKSKQSEINDEEEEGSEEEDEDLED
ncbi:hypothetical protein R1flu_028043 [Riccia fluitans]|uniref:HMG box domain-containing protein n=1 Tax=Riccia fluitans TaxID=41844 RepID=A0ABD1XKJ2_9MARC